MEAQKLSQEGILTNINRQLIQSVSEEYQFTDIDNLLIFRLYVATRNTIWGFDKTPFLDCEDKLNKLAMSETVKTVEKVRNETCTHFIELDPKWCKILFGQVLEKKVFIPEFQQEFSNRLVSETEHLLLNLSTMRISRTEYEAEFAKNMVDVLDQFGSIKDFVQKVLIIGAEEAMPA